MTALREPYPLGLFLLLHQARGVKRTLSACTFALFAVSLAAAGADAETRPTPKAARPDAANSAVGECFKRGGGGYDPVAKRWTVHMSENDMTVRMDTIRQCIGRATGVSPGSVRIREREIY
jgi:hypothetical protein